MADYDKKKEEVATEADNTPTTGIGVAQQVFQNQYDSLGDQYVAEQAAVDAQRAKYDAQAQKVSQAREEGKSVIGALLEKEKPVYDANKEKRLRNRAIVQSLGDMLSAVAMGAHAYGKKGAGYVPKPTEGGHLSSLSEADKMREEYRKRGEAWKTLNLGIKKSQAEADVAAEEKLLTVEAARLKDATTKAEATRKAQADLLNAWNKSAADYYMDYDKETRRAANTAAQKAQDYDYDVALEAIKAQNERNGGLTDDEMAELQYIRDYVGDDSIYGTKTVQSTTKKKVTTTDALGRKTEEFIDVPTTKEQARTRGELKTGDYLDIISKYQKDDKAATYIYLRKGGLSHDKAMEKVNEMYPEGK